MRTSDVPTTTAPRTIGRILLAAALIFAGLSHLFWARKEFRAQVPTWVPMDADAVVVGSVRGRDRARRLAARPAS